jgi:hypothetical protein
MPNFMDDLHTNADYSKEISMNHRTKINGIAVALGLALATLTSTAHAQLYGLSSSRPSTLFTLDTSTGAASAVTNLTGNRETDFVGIAFMDGTLYATDVMMPDFSLTFGTIDLVTGAYNPISNQGGFNHNWWCLAANHSTKMFYTVDRSDGNLKTVTKTGVTSTIGNTGLTMVGLTYDDKHNILYGVDLGTNVNSLWTIDTSTGVPTKIGELPMFGNWIDIAYDPDTDKMFLNDGDFTRLWEIDPNDASLSLIGSNNQSALIDGIAFKDAAPAAVPEPSTAAAVLMGAAVLTLFVVRGRRRSLQPHS